MTLAVIALLIPQVAACESPDTGTDRRTETDTTNEATEQPMDEDERKSSPLADHAWEHRPVIVFAPSSQDSTYDKQQQIFETHRPGLDDRDIVIYRVFDDQAEGPEGQLDERAAEALRKRFDPEDEFSVILVGKDTTEKLRRADILEADELFSTIDAMPMRQREMQE